MNTLPHFDYWMLSQLDAALQPQYEKLMKTHPDAKYLNRVAKEVSHDAAERERKKFESSRYHSFGAVVLAQQRIQEIKDVYKKELQS